MFAIGDKEWPGIGKLIEEKDEVGQVLGKLLGSRGNTNHWSGDLRAMLIDEMGDLSAAMTFVLNHNFSAEEKTAFLERAEMKLRLFNEWHKTDPKLPDAP